ncbi:MAG: hypothetical protein NUW24_05130 [Anaerolineae bacterium]|jgi:hypothetical protein|nr:hypothetical protein [Anaerolineae bacterium]MDH7473020.1 hypothetical protein [Anaerolineae bacterium]
MLRNLLVALILTALAVAIYALILFQVDWSSPTSIAALVAWGLSFAFLFLLGNPDLLAWLGERRKQPLFLGAPVLVLLIPYLLLVLFSGQFSWWGLLAALLVLSLPTAAAIFNGPQETGGLTLLDGAVVLFCGAVMTWGWWPGAVYPGWTEIVGQPVAAFAPLLAALVAYLMGVVRRITDFGYHWQLDREDGEWLATVFVLMLTLALPLGFAGGAMTVRLPALSPARLLGQLVRCFVVTLPPALLFQGVAQELTERRLGEKAWSPWVALVVGTILFVGSQSLALGLKSLGELGMIIVVGLCCGYVYLRTRKVVVAVLLYGLFLYLWWVLLGGG